MNATAIVATVTTMIAAAAEATPPRGEPNIAMGIFGILLLTLGPLVGAVVMGLVQLGLYRLCRCGPERTPIFPVLLMRGLFVILAVIAATAIYLKFIRGEPAGW